MVVTTIRSVYVEDVLAVSAVSLAPFAPRLRKRLSRAYATSVYMAAHRGTATRAASECRGVASYKARSTVPTFGPLGTTRRTMSGTGASASRANADGSTSFRSRAAMRVGQNPKAAASSQRAGRDSRATDFIRPLLGKRPPIAVQPPSTMPSLLTMRSYRAFVRTSTSFLSLSSLAFDPFAGNFTRRVRACFDPSVPCHRRDEPGRFEVRIESGDLVHVLVGAETPGDVFRVCRGYGGSRMMVAQRRRAARSFARVSPQVPFTVLSHVSGCSPSQGGQEQSHAQNVFDLAV